jgi:hypothetical protein
MSKLKLILLIFIYISLLPNNSIGQGCSDAGFCTIDSFKPNNSDSTNISDSTKTVYNQFKIGAFAGSADHSISVYGSYVEYNRLFSEKVSLDFKLTSLAQIGNGISAFGISDFFVNMNYRASKKFKVTIGAKIPLSNGGKSLDGLPLPMDYQASLGTFDLIFGVGYDIHKLQIIAAIQQPLTQNSNQFFASNYSPSSALRSFQSTNGFKRTGDVMLRVSYPLSLGKKLKLTPSLLPIYHLLNDQYTDELNIEREIIGSQGLTLNGNVYVDYEINEKSSFQINMGKPFIVREARPDGLTRSFIANFEYRIRF